MAATALGRDPTTRVGRDPRGDPEILLYLAGPMTGHTFDEVIGWRDYVRQHLTTAAPHVRCLDPMRAKDHFQDAGRIGPEHYHRGMLEPRAIVARDFWDLRRADVMMLNLTGADVPSIGCMVELGFAHANSCLTVVILEPGDRNPHDHLFVHALASAVVHSLDDAIAVVEAL